MDPINIIIAINLFATITANASGAKSGMKDKLSKIEKKPNTYLQKLPPNVAAVVLILTIIGIFNVGTFNESLKSEYFSIRIIGVVLFIIFSWLQVYTFKYLGNSYSQDIVIKKGHNLIKSGPYKYIRHPQYLSQILSDLGVGLALLGYLIIPIVVLIELPLFLLRAKKEDNLLMNHFGDSFTNYKKKAGFIIPFIG